MEARYLTDLEWRICHAVNIYLYRNGKDGEAPILVHIPPGKKKTMKTVMNVLQERVKFPVGFAAYLYRMDGKRVRHPGDLEMYNNYVVASNYDKHFKCAQYGRKRSPLLVLNRESKHIRVLRQKNENYYEWSIKKKGIGEERPQYDYSSTMIPSGPMVPNYGPSATNYGPSATNYGPSPSKQGLLGPTKTPRSGGGQGQKKGYPPTNSQMPMYPRPPTAYAVNTCLVTTNQSAAKQVLKERQEFHNLVNENEVIVEHKKDHIMPRLKHHPGGRHQKERKVSLRVSDILNLNTVQNDRKNADEDYVSDSSKNSFTSGSESVLETDCLGNKYQEMLRQYKKKLKKQAMLEVQTSSSSMQLSLLRNNFKTNKLPILSAEMSARMMENDEEIIVLPPPPIEFRDGIIPRRGTFYSFNPHH